MPDPGACLDPAGRPRDLWVTRGCPAVAKCGWLWPGGCRSCEVLSCSWSLRPASSMLGSACRGASPGTAAFLERPRRSKAWADDGRELDGARPAVWLASTGASSEWVLAAEAAVLRPLALVGDALLVAAFFGLALQMPCTMHQSTSICTVSKSDIHLQGRMCMRSSCCVGVNQVGQSGQPPWC